MNSLQDITDAWGNWFARKNSTTLDFTASTRFSGNWHLDPYHEYEAKVKVLPATLRYGSPRSKGESRGEHLDVEYKNGSSILQSYTQMFAYEYLNSFEYSFTEALKLGLEVKFDAGLPLIGGASSTAKFELDISSTQKQTNSHKTTRTETFPVNVAPHTSVKFSARSKSQNNECDWQVSTLLSGYIAVRFKDYLYWNTPKAHALWFLRIEDIFKDVSWHDIIDMTGYQVTSQGVEVMARGTCDSTTDTITQASIKEAPYTGTEVGQSSTYQNDSEQDTIGLGSTSDAKLNYTNGIDTTKTARKVDTSITCAYKVIPANEISETNKK